METAQQPNIPVPQDPTFSMNQGVLTIDEIGQALFQPNANAVYRCITLQDDTNSVFLSFGDSNPGYGIGITLSPNHPCHEFFIDSKLKVWARGRIWARSDGNNVPVSFVEVSFQGR